jgi:hypothetical protein
MCWSVALTGVSWGVIGVDNQHAMMAGGGVDQVLLLLLVLLLLRLAQTDC